MNQCRLLSSIPKWATDLLSGCFLEQGTGFTLIVPVDRWPAALIGEFEATPTVVFS